jgi:hypothetical protein
MNKRDYTEQYYKHLYEKLSNRAYLLEKMLKKKKIDMAKKASSKLDPVGKEDEDVDNDGKPNTTTDKYIKNRREKIKQAMMKKKKVVEEGTIVTNGEIFYGGFPKLNEAKYDIPATVGEIESRRDDPSTVGVDEMLKILKGGGSPIMAGQTQNGQRGVPPEIRKQAIQHLETIKSHPQGQIPNYSKEHPVYKQGKAAHDFFLKHFPEFGVEDDIADSHDIHRL